VHAHPVQLHAVAFALFASVIAPFGGFFASGFKRAFKLKDFADLIPGHGGVIDRMDCQFVMGMFTFVYHLAFIATYTTPELVLDQARTLTASQQLTVLRALAADLNVRLPPA